MEYVTTTVFIDTHNTTKEAKIPISRIFMFVKRSLTSHKATKSDLVMWTVINFLVFIILLS
jgi:hypothetical protein